MIRNYFPRGEQGIATLPTIIAVTILLIALAIGITALSLSNSLVSVGQNNSQQALIYAEAGARDALVKIARNKNFTCAAANCYSIDFAANGCTNGTACAQVSVSAATGTTAAPKIITSTGQVQTNSQKVEVDVIFDSSLNGQIATTTWQELAN